MKKGEVILKKEVEKIIVGSFCFSKEPADQLCFSCKKPIIKTRISQDGQEFEIHLVIFLKNENLSETFQCCLDDKCQPFEVDEDNLENSKKQKRAEIGLTRERAIRNFLTAQRNGEIIILPQKELVLA